MADDDANKTTQIPTGGATQPQPAATQPSPPVATQPGPPAGGTPPKSSGGGVPTPVVIIGGIVLVAAIAFAIFSFMGKSSADDDKKKAEDQVENLEQENRDLNTEVEAAEEEIGELNTRVEDLSQQLGQSEEFAAALDAVLSTGVTAADSLYDCSVTAYEFILNGLNSGNFDPGQAQAVDDRCLSAEDNYNAFNTALNDLANA
jgi:hypothetical protein